MKPLAIDRLEEDDHDELKGCALWAVWPTHMTADELFASLTVPKIENFVGPYQTFVSERIVPYLSIADLPSALSWVEKQGPADELPMLHEDLINNIFAKAWDYLGQADVLQSFARAVCSRLVHDEGIMGGRFYSLEFEKRVANEPGARHRVLEEILSLIPDNDEHMGWLVWSKIPLVRNEDVKFMVDRIGNSTSAGEQAVLTSLIKMVFDPFKQDQLEAIFVAAQNNDYLSVEFAWFLKPVEFGSPEAHKMKEQYKLMRQLAERVDQKHIIDPPPSERVVSLLDAFELGDYGAWWRLNMEMTLRVDSTHYGSDFESDLTLTPGWEAADEAKRKRIVEAAHRYLLEADPLTQSWLGTNTFYRQAYAGYRALFLLSKEAPGLLDTIPSDVWEKWAPTIMDFPISSGARSEKEPHCRLVRKAYEQAPAELVGSLLALIDKENREHGDIFIIWKIEDCWDERLAQVLSEKVKDQGLQLRSMRTLLGKLLEHQVLEARDLAQSLLTLPIPSGDDIQARAVLAASTLIIFTEDSAWSTVWNVIKEDEEFGRRVLTLVSREISHHEKTIQQRLTLDSLVDLYLWLVRNYPHSEDSGGDNIRGTVSDRQSIAWFRDAILGYLKELGTPESCNAIRRTIAALPELDWLKWVLQEAQALTRQRTCKPPLPVEILRLASDQRLRLVQNGKQLLDVIVDSLVRLQAKIHGETPAGIFLWDKIDKTTYKPKEENLLSDFLKIHFEDDLKQTGVVVNREVQIHHGERTDLHVDAVTNTDGTDYDRISAIIEVKGSWHPELEQAMSTQLVDRYLSDNRCQSGLYVIGWYACDIWDDEDYRKRNSPKYDILEAKVRFEAQALDLSQSDLQVRAFIMDTSLR